MTANTITRKQYLENSKELHSAYWGQFVTEGVKQWVKSSIGIDSLLASNDPHFNDIPLEKWDRFFNTALFAGEISRNIRDSGDVNARCSANACCVAKHAAYALIDALAHKCRGIKIYLDNGDAIETDINGTRASILKYYNLSKYDKGITLNIGDGAGNDKFAKVERIKFL